MTYAGIAISTFAGASGLHRRFAEIKSNALTTEPRLLPDAVDKISIYATEVMYLPLFVCLSVSLANS